MIDDEEVEGLVSTIPQASIKRKEYEQSDAKGRHYQSKRQRQLCMLIFLFLGLAITMFRLLPLQAAVRTAEKPHKQLEYSCPAASTSLSTVNYDENVFASDYLNNKTQPTDIWSDPQTFLNQFREETFDGWSRSYTKFKEDLRPFLQKHVVPLLRKQKPSTIYESACGLGLNLYATLEILQEEANITGITVYGNEYLEENAIKANRILDVLLEAQNTQSNPKNHKGVVCHADSTNLTHVPSASFDLVYTGFLRYACSEAPSPRRKKDILYSPF